MPALHYLNGRERLAPGPKGNCKSTNVKTQNLKKAFSFEATHAIHQVGAKGDHSSNWRRVVHFSGTPIEVKQRQPLSNQNNLPQQQKGSSPKLLVSLHAGGEFRNSWSKFQQSNILRLQQSLPASHICLPQPMVIELSLTPSEGQIQ